MPPRHRQSEATAASGASAILRRRDFVQGIVRGAGAKAFPAALAGADPPPFTLAIHASMFGRHRPPELYRHLRETGYRFIELAGAQIRAAATSEESARRLSKELQDAGLRPVSAFVVDRIASGDEASPDGGSLPRACAGWASPISAPN